jgi:hypothetical protein
MVYGKGKLENIAKIQYPPLAVTSVAEYIGQVGL